MASFDVVNKIEIQTVDDAINAAKREIETRYDFRGSNSTIEFDKKGMIISILTEDEMRMDSIGQVLIGRFVRQKLDPKCLDFGKEKYASGKHVKKDIRIKSGIDKEMAKKIVNAIKDTKLKVQASIMDDQVRVQGKKIDDLQSVMSTLRSGDFDLPLQFVNMK